MAQFVKMTLTGVHLTKTTIDKFVKYGPKAIHRASSKMATYCARRERKYLKGPYSKGRTQIRKTGAKGNYTITATHPQGDAALASIEYGAAPHLIPNNPIWKGRIHPGMEGKHFASKAFDETTRKANRIIGQALKEFGL